MMTKMQEITAEQINENPFDLIGKQWALISVQDGDKANTMTASWGGLGVLWGKNVATIYVRPQRHTFTMLQKQKKVTLSFLDDKYRKVLNYCGSHSGRDTDKIADTGLTAVTEEGWVYFDEAKLVLECEVLYEQNIDPACFLDAALDENYKQKDYHRMFVAEIKRVYKQSE